MCKRLESDFDSSLFYKIVPFTIFTGRIESTHNIPFQVN